MLRVLIIVSHYLPGFKAGGPIRTIANLIDRLGNEFEFSILTADRDLGDNQPYPDIRLDDWQLVGNAKVRYVPMARWRTWFWRHSLQQIDYDVLYLNSCFAASTRSILLLRRLGLVPATPLILAPRGEFSQGALAIKSLKKRLYLTLTRRLHLYDGVIWQASSELERRDILRVNGLGLNRGCDRVVVAPDLPARESETCKGSSPNRLKTPGQIRLIFLSRITPMKNLDGALRLLMHACGQIQFDIYGTLEDKGYWRECQELIRQLPPHVAVTYHGEISHASVPCVLMQYHAMLLPTHGENYGHVILESLRAGCPVLISDQTPWRGLQVQRAGWDLALSDVDGFHAALDDLVNMDNATFQIWSQASEAYGRKTASDSGVLDANRRLFLESVTNTIRT